MKPHSLDAFYTKLAPVLISAAGTSIQSTQREVGHFNLFHLADLMPSFRNRPPMAFDRRDYYKISLVCGRSQVQYAEQVVEVEQYGLWVATPRVPYRWLPHDLAQTGYFCIFTDEFLRPAQGGTFPDELPIFQPGHCPVWELTSAEYAAVEVVFQKMAQEIASNYAYKYDLLRTYLWELVHLGQKLQPTPVQPLIHSAAARLAGQFAELLERQFPLAIPQQQLCLRTAKDYASALAVHVNHLNRVLKEATGHTTTELVSGRVAQEAKLLLKQTNWTVSEIADSLGFADVAHFCNFFKRQTSLTPSDFRN